MKKILTLLAVAATAQLQAQVLYVNNSNGTHRPIDTKAVEQITFDEAQRVFSIAMNDGTENRFSTEKADSISPVAAGTELTYDSKKSVTFDAADATAYNEIIETIEKDELVDEYGDFVENYSTTAFVTITFSEKGVTCEGVPSNVTYKVENGTHIVINSTRTKVGYEVKGNCSNGSLKIYSTKKFQLMTSGLTLTNPTGPAINIQSGKTVYFTLGAGTVNTLCDGETYAAPTVGSDGSEEDQKGTLFSEGQLIFNGRGTLNVTSKGGHAICSDDYIRVRSGNINILSAAKDGFHTNDLFRVGRTATATPVITINAGSDGIDCGKGSVIIEAGKFDITSDGEAFNVSNEDAPAEAHFTISGGFIKALTTGEKAAVVKTGGNFTQNGGIIQGEVKGGGSKIVNCDGDITFNAGKLTGVAHGSLSSDTTTAGGFKSEGNLTIKGGIIAIDCKGSGSKGFNCNGTLTINGGEVTLLAEAPDFVADEYDRKTRTITTVGCNINGGTVYAKSYDYAINATATNFADGIINAVSSNATAIGGSITQKGGWLLLQNAQ